MYDRQLPSYGAKRSIPAVPLFVAMLLFVGPAFFELPSAVYGRAGTTAQPEPRYVAGLCRPSATAVSRILDAGISSLLLNEYSCQPALSNVRIQVETLGGAVRLTGDVRYKAQRALAERIARGMHGVKSVANMLDVTD